MKNTYIPLSIAYLDSEGRILNIEDMEPQDLTGIRSSGPAMFALEANKGWFEERGISAGDIVQGLLGGALQEAAGPNLSDQGFHYADVVQPIIEQIMSNLGTSPEEGEYLINHSSSIILLRNGKFLSRISHHANYEKIFSTINKYL